MKKYILNHYYTLRHDRCRSYIMSQSDYHLKKPINVNSGWITKVHPAYAMMLSFFSCPTAISDAVENISAFFGIKNKDIVLDFITKLIEAEEPVYSTMDGYTSGFPVNLLIEESHEFAKRQIYIPEDFGFKELDFKANRMYVAPLSIVFMPNNNCLTDCVYCYADKRRLDNVLSFDVIERFVQEANKLKVRDLLITGGDFFMYKKWKELLDLLNKNGYFPDLISTKVPLDESQISTFSKYKIRLQLSLDSLSNDVVMSMHNVSSSYLDKMLSSIKLIDQSGIGYQIATVVTCHNDSISEIEKLATFIEELDNVERWEIRIAFKSLYSKSDFDLIKSNRSKIDIIEKWIKENNNRFKNKLLWSPDDDVKYKKSAGGSKNFEGPKCAANISNMVILPDGNVTICEQLYWNPNFIIGNIANNGIEEIWNGSKALSIWKKDIRSIKNDSQCKCCKDFKDCFDFGNRCYANIIKAYGDDNIDYPDLRCQYAPNFLYDITHE